MEQDDSSARPAIAGAIPDLRKYDTVLLGYPIWFGQAPKIIYTFLEAGDFSGKTIIPFCTSGSSPIGSSAKNLQSLAPGANWQDGRRFAGSASATDVATWATGLAVEKDAEKMIQMKINDEVVSVDWQDNASVTALREKLKSGPLTISMNPYGGFEQVGSLGFSLTRNDAQTTTAPGDIVLYSGDQIVLFYGSNSWSYTRLGKLSGLSNDEITTMLSGDSVTVTLELTE